MVVFSYERVIYMTKENNTQVVLVNLNPVDSSIQITIPPFRPVHLYEIEDYFDELVEEVETNIYETTIQKGITNLLQAFKDAMEEGDILPLMDYFGKQNFRNVRVEEVRMIFEAIKNYQDTQDAKTMMLH